MKPPVEVPPKKPYSAPKLLIYGNLTEMTLAMSPTGNADGGSTGLKTMTG